jgi:UMF1 family MFS transporter
MGVFLVAQFGFVSANVFYDAFLPHLTSPATIDRVSSIGYAFGYAGGGLQLVLSLALVTNAGALGLDGPTAARGAISLAGLWWLLFGIYAVRGLPEPGRALLVAAGRSRLEHAAAYTRHGFAHTWSTFRRLRRFPALLGFLVAYMLYNDGVQTMNAMASAYATDTLQLGLSTVIAVFLISQVSALPGALAFGWLAGRVGAKRAILGTLLLWTAVAVGASLLVAGDAAAFAGLAVVAGLAQGGNQALSRSLFGSMIPDSASAELFGFYSVFAKFSAIWGPLLFGAIATATGSGRPAILILAVFFVAGAVLLARVDVPAGRAAVATW